MNIQRWYDLMPKTTENWLNAAAFGHKEHLNISNVTPTESYKMSERSMFPYNHSSTNKSAKLFKRQAIAVQVIACFEWYTKPYQ